MDYPNTFPSGRDSQGRFWPPKTLRGVQYGVQWEIPNNDAGFVRRILKTIDFAACFVGLNSTGKMVLRPDIPG
jgi:hypothetical protein